MTYTAILSSVPFESELLLAELRSVKKTSIAGRDVYQGELFKKNILLMNTGIGKVNAALSAAALLENFKIRFIINIGIGGSYPNSGLKAGDIAIAEKEIYGDEGVITSKGIEGMQKIGIPLVQIGKRKYFNEFPLNTNLFNTAAGMALRITQIKTGSFVTVSAATATRELALQLEKRYNALCENMEGAAVAQVCTIYGISMLELRGISNIVGIRDKRKWNIKLAAENCQKAVLETINSL
ncbi:MAG: futalosine hydrolase [Thermodesulfovibrionia bacterium]|nr:futalosine hydrolase [Thermodesulfovibrionia bacterium]